jgi:hypothetical protein
MKQSIGLKALPNNAFSNLHNYERVQKTFFGTVTPIGTFPTTSKQIFQRDRVLFFLPDKEQYQHVLSVIQWYRRVGR